MENYHKQLKKYHSFKKKQSKIHRIKKRKSFKNENKKTYFDKLYIRIFLSSILLFLLISAKNIFKLDLVNHLNSNINVIPILNLFTNIYEFNHKDLEVNLTTNYENINYLEGVNYITNESFNGVSSAATGIVIKINKIDDLYYVTIKSENNLEYTYGGLSSIDVSLYSYVVVNNIIGSAQTINNHYTFTIEIKDKDNVYSLLTLHNA